MATWYVHYEPGVSGTLARASVATEAREIQAPIEPEDLESARAMFGHPIHSDAGTLSGGDWEEARPLTYMQDRDTGKRARSTNDGTTATQFLLDLGADPNDWLVGVIAIVGHNLSTSALVQITGSDESDLSPAVYESGWVDAYREIYPWGILRPGEPGYANGRPADTQPTGIPFIQYVPDVACRYWLFEFDDTLNPDGWLEIGRLIVASRYQPSGNFQPGASMAVQTRTVRDDTDSGSFVHDEKPNRRVFDGTFDAIDEDEAHVRFHDLDVLIGTSRPFLFIAEPAKNYHVHRGAFPAVMEKMNPLTWLAEHQRRGQGVTVLEEL